MIVIDRKRGIVPVLIQRLYILLESSWPVTAIFYGDRMLRFLLPCTFIFLDLITPAYAIDKADVRETAHTVFDLYLTPHEAYNMKMEMGDGVLLVDVRARTELKYVGASDLIDANIPSRFVREDYAFSDKSSTYRTRRNDHFVEDMKKLLKLKNLDKTAPIILMCTSGSRVPKVAKLLKESGFENVYSQYQGFEGIKTKSGPYKGKRLVYGWRNSGLPWGYKLKKSAMYFNFDSTSLDNGE